MSAKADPTLTGSSAGDPRERELLEAARDGDQDAFAQLVESYRRELQVHCYGMLGSHADAEDALQETLLRAWRGLARFEGRSSLRSWLYRIATNRCLSAIERRPKRVVPIDYAPAADPHDRPADPVKDRWMATPYLPAGTPAPYAYDVRVRLETGIPLAEVTSPSHNVAVQFRPLPIEFGDERVWSH